MTDTANPRRVSMSYEQSRSYLRAIAWLVKHTRCDWIWDSEDATPEQCATGEAHLIAHLYDIPMSKIVDDLRIAVEFKNGTPR